MAINFRRRNQKDKRTFYNWRRRKTQRKTYILISMRNVNSMDNKHISDVKFNKVVFFPFSLALFSVRFNITQMAFERWALDALYSLYIRYIYIYIQCICVAICCVRWTTERETLVAPMTFFRRMPLTQRGNEWMSSSEFIFTCCLFSIKIENLA